MRLIHIPGEEEDRDRGTQDINVQEIDTELIPRYAILSHTWEDEEVSLQDITASDVSYTTKKKGYEKIRNCCAVAKRNNIDHVWIDSCCIDKTSSAELSEAINSMYRWYLEAEVCYAYLSDVSPSNEDTPVQITKSRWFTRGWTLQELVAPEVVIFFDRDWNEIGTKISLQQEIAQRTTIPPGVLSGTTGLEDVSVARRMSWAAGRKTKRVEDRAYSLMGIFGVYMPLLYGEGDVAFLRLQEEIIKVQDDYTIFAWKSELSSYGGLLAITPDAFAGSADIVPKTAPGTIKKSPWMITNQGIHLELPFVGLGPRGLGLAILPCVLPEAESLAIAVILRDTSLAMERFERVGYQHLLFLDLEYLRPPQYPFRQICVQQQRLALTSRRRPATGTFPIDQGMKEIDDMCDRWRSSRLTYTHAPKKESDSTPLDSFKPPTSLQELFDAVNNHDTHHWISTYLLNPHFNINTPNDKGTTLLSLVAANGLTDIAWILISRSDTDIHPRDTNDLTPLFHAAINNHTTIMNLIMNRGYTPADLTTKTAQTVLHHASKSGHIAVAQFLLDRPGSSDPNAKDSTGRTPIIYAVEAGHEQMARLLLAHGADPHQTDTSGKTALHWAVLQGTPSLVQLLLSHGASIEAQDVSQRTALHWAALSGNVVVVAVLLRAGARMQPKGSVSETPLHLAATHGREGVVEALLAYGASVRSLDSSNKTALHCAAGNGHGHVAQLLLSHGAATQCVDFTRHTPLDYAKEKGHPGVVELLRAWRAQSNTTSSGDSDNVGVFRRLVGKK